jgi:hypothetical protein
MEWEETLGNNQSERFTSLATKMEENLKILFSSVEETQDRHPRVRVHRFSEGR